MFFIHAVYILIRFKHFKRAKRFIDIKGVKKQHLVKTSGRTELTGLCRNVKRKKKVHSTASK